MRAAALRSVLASVLVVAPACTVGQGHGRVQGSVHDELCGVDIPSFSLNPDFFAADIIEDRGEAQIRRRLTLRIQRGSYREHVSDGLLIYVDDANEIERSRLGQPIAVGPGPDADVQMTFYLNQTCESGFPRRYWTVPLVLEAQSGTITFDAIYAPDVESSTDIEAHFEDVVFTNPEDPPGQRIATLSGEISFYYVRGRPAQPFP